MRSVANRQESKHAMDCSNAEKPRATKSKTNSKLPRLVRPKMKSVGSGQAELRSSKSSSECVRSKTSEIKPKQEELCGDRIRSGSAASNTEGSNPDRAIEKTGTTRPVFERL